MNTTATEIDSTSCERILRYLERDPKIEGITEIIDPAVALAYVGDLYVNNQVEKVKELFRAKKIIHYKDGKFCRTPPKNCVNCLRLEPVYLIKDLKRMYV